MITISETAQSHFAKLLSDQAEATNIRVFVVNPGTSQAECGVSYCPADAVEESDIRLNFNGFDAVVDAESAPFLDEAEIDFVTDKMGTQLTLKAPNAKAKKLSENADLNERVEYMLTSEVNPQLANHGGQVSLVEITAEGIAILQFGGGCNGCSMIDVTLKEGIEKEMIAKFDEITGVRDITEHQAGEHSYY
ncbi:MULTISPECIES: Fe-S biogenesis protein NfuA [Pseudoalteromonas]|uniref:Fe/S biogenesis protein NfuA n=1 Tax=Pseudoalteromonas aurantia 208 TaxID=1314867 RepID=A0ABR9EA03_9GAMM|nr:MULTISPECIES: Fe-S biogenesis protein NfuA [Pseudoalteromonas]MBE0366603.1 Fe/S biogenesis protein NfuA [Pseudoalteromonas aurantia 208]MBQ4848032.1 Fe-S biogenesis protein NfuA [Pseudoalteromonas sp. MMG005]MBQ4850471.1 Fe-S biogenesis protein NfuA [Pseudoalteromonas sp. MMG012]